MREKKNKKPFDQLVGEVSSLIVLGEILLAFQPPFAQLGEKKKKKKEKRRSKKGKEV